MTKSDISVHKEEIQKLKQDIAGEISMSENPGNAFKKWQNIFEISQLSLARQMKLSCSTISDYENGRRNNPSIKLVQRFVNTLIELDLKHKGQIIRKLITIPSVQVFETKEFKRGIKIKHTEGLKELTQVNTKNPNELVFGISYLDAQNIPELESSDLQKLFGKTNKRIFYINNVQSPLLIHMFLKSLKLATNLYPSILILETTKTQDEINKDIDVNIPIYITQKNKDEIKTIVKDL